MSRCYECDGLGIIDQEEIWDYKDWQEQFKEEHDVIGGWLDDSKYACEVRDGYYVICPYCIGEYDWDKTIARGQK